MRQLRWLSVGFLVLVALLLPARAARPDAAARHTVHAGQGPVADLQTEFNYVAPEGASSVSGGATVQGHPSWDALLSNPSPGAVSNATISVATGFDPSVFAPPLPASDAYSTPVLAPGQWFGLTGSTMGHNYGEGGALLARGVQDSFRLGYDSSISGPTLIPVGGGDATESFTVTVTDPRYLGGSIGVGQIDNGGVQAVSLSDPANLDQGETVVDNGLNDGGGRDLWVLNNFRLDKPYTFTAVVHVSNPANPFGNPTGPLVFQPFGAISVGTEVGAPGTGSSVTVADPSIDGSFTFSVDAPASIQGVSHEVSYVTHYPFVTRDLTGWINSTLSADVPAGADSVTNGAALPATWSWELGIGAPGTASTTVTTPSITVESGDAPSLLEPNGGAPAASLPIVFTGPTTTIVFKQNALDVLLGSTITGTLRPGCATSRSVSPLEVPAGGGDQTVTLTVRCADPSVEEVDVNEQVAVPGATVVSASGPSDGWVPDTPSDAYAGYGFGDGIQTGTTYTFTAVVQVPNPYGRPFLDQPLIAVTEDSEGIGCFVCSGPSPQTSVSLPVPSLDGPTAGAGSVTFSTGDPKEWAIGVFGHGQYTYPSATGPFTQAECTNGGWQGFGVFKNQGDCVSYVATGGKNGPGGG